MRLLRHLMTGMALLIGAGLALAQAQPKETQDEFVKTGQGIADTLRQSTGADLAFFPFGLLKESVSGRTLDQSVEFPTEEVVIVKLTGQQVRSALERGLSLFPTSNPAYLYVSGLEAAFRPNAQPESRIASVSLGSNPLNPSGTYRVAMPSSLGKGGLGYFTVWNRSAIEQGTAGKTMDAILSGRQPGTAGLRLKAAPGAEQS